MYDELFWHLCKGEGVQRRKYKYRDDIINLIAS
jgi:hypothetical protein